MGKSGSSCLRIFACDGDPEETGDVEGKASKHTWSFRKRSTSRRVISNNVMLETVSTNVNGKDDTEHSNAHHSSPTNVVVSEKSRVVKFADEVPSILSATLESEVSNSFLKTESTTNSSDSALKGSAAITIQNAAEKELAKIKNVVKLQAAVRGHLVRKQAVGTLHCVQAVIKMQALVRARHARRNAGKLGDEDARCEKSLVKKDSETIHSIMYSSTEKLLANGFARQLLERAPSKKARSIRISCDPSRSGSSWQWLERWMTVTSSVGPNQELHLATQELEVERVKVDTAEIVDVPVAQVLSSKQQAEVVNKDTCLTTHEPDRIDFEAPISPTKKESSSNTTDGQQHTKSSKASGKCDSDLVQVSVGSEVNLQPDPLNERQVDMDKSMYTTKGLSEPRENEQRSGFGSKKCNPDFAAAQLKFEKLSYISNSDKATSPLHDIVDKKSGNGTSQSHLTTRPDIFFTQNSTLHTKAQSAISECGTEISISSTLDSPDRSEAEGGEIILEINGFGRMDYVATATANDRRSFHNVSSKPNFATPGAPQEKNHDGEYTLDSGSAMVVEHSTAAPVASAILPQEPFSKQSQEPAGLGGFSNNTAAHDGLPNSLFTEPDALHALSIESAAPNASSIESAVSDELPLEPVKADVMPRCEEATDQQTCRSSFEGSLASHLTTPDLHGTPSSEASSNAKKKKASRSVLSKKQRFQLSGKSSPLESNTESGASSTKEHLEKDIKNAKRRNSLGASNPDHGDFEPRISSSNSFPSYMQATQSARAKVHAGNSPKVSPDVHDKESYARKRHSLPFGNGKQGSSPRLVRSTSQAQQSLKGTNTQCHTSAERKWQR